MKQPPVTTTANMPHDTCSACGKGGESLKTCNSCKEVKYCSRECQVRDWKTHKRACKLRAAEIHEKQLFMDPPVEDCPICLVRLEGDANHANFQLCCGQVICNGCLAENRRVGVEHFFKGNSLSSALDFTNCPFCRSKCYETDEEGIAMVNNLLKINPNNADAMHFLAHQTVSGAMGVEKDVAKANELWMKAAKLGKSDSMNSVANSYNMGRGVELNQNLAQHWYEKAAMAGHSQARYNLGIFEVEKNNKEKAVKHWMLAAKGGFLPALSKFREGVEYGLLEKELLVEASHCYKKYLDEVMTEPRRRAAREDSR